MLTQMLQTMTKFSTGKHKVNNLARLLHKHHLVSNIFLRFMKEYKFSDLARLCKVATKEEHTVIEKWPFRMKLHWDHPGAMEEFDRLVDETMLAKERFVEWRRI